MTCKVELKTLEKEFSLISSRSLSLSLSQRSLWEEEEGVGEEVCCVGCCASPTPIHPQVACNSMGLHEISIGIAQRPRETERTSTFHNPQSSPASLQSFPGVLVGKTGVREREDAIQWTAFPDYVTATAQNVWDCHRLFMYTDACCILYLYSPPLLLKRFCSHSAWSRNQAF